MSSLYTLKIVDDLMFALPDTRYRKYIHSTNNKNNSKAEIKTFRALKAYIWRGRKVAIEVIEWEGGHVCNNSKTNTWGFFTVLSSGFCYCIAWCLIFVLKSRRWVLQITLLIEVIYPPLSYLSIFWWICTNGKYLKHSKNKRPMKETSLYLMVGR